MEKTQRPVLNRGALVALPVIAIFLWAFFAGGLDQNPWRLLPPFLVVVVLIAAAAVLGARRRMKTLQRVSQELGLQFAEEGDRTSMQAVFDSSDIDAAVPELQREMMKMGAPPAIQQALMAKMASAKSAPGLEQSGLRRLTPFQDVDRPRARNVMAGSLGGADALAFDYTYDTRQLNPGKSISVSQTVAVFRFRGRAIPTFELSPEGFLKEGGQDLDFASHPVFSKRFRLRGDDETAVRSLFNPRVLSFFERLRDDFRETVEGNGEYVIVYRSNRSLKPEAVHAFVKEATTVASTLASARF
jgi:hypothetical protein